MQRLFIYILLCVAPFLLGAKHRGPSYDTKPRYALDAFAQTFAKKHALEFLNSGLGAFADAKKGIWGINLVCRRAMTMEEGQKLAKELSFQLLHKVFHDPLFANYCKHTPPNHFSAELREELVAFRIGFWDEETNRPLFPYLAQVRLADGNLYFHYADPVTQALQDPVIIPLASLNLPNYRN